MMPASSRCRAWSEGATAASDVFRRSSLRSISSGSASASKRAASAASSVVAAITAVLAAAARALVSSVIKLFWTHAARPASIHRSSKRVSARSMNACASATVGPSAPPAQAPAPRAAAAAQARSQCQASCADLVSPRRKAPLHSSGHASRPAALLLCRAWPICSLAAPRQPGAWPLPVRRGVSPRAVILIASAL